MNKQEILTAYIKHLDEKIEKTEQALESICHGIDTAPTPSESHSDTTRSQQSRVALEISNRLSALKKAKTSASAISSTKFISLEVGALVVIQDDFGEKEYYFQPKQ